MTKEQHECEQCGEVNTITRDIKGNIVPDDCYFCGSKICPACNTQHTKDEICPLDIPF